MIKKVIDRLITDECRPISHNIKITYLIFCSFPLSSQKSSVLSRRGPQTFGGVLWCLAGRCLLWIFSVLCDEGWDLHWSSQSHWCLIRMESWEFGGQRLRPFVVVLELLWSSSCVVSGCTVLLGGPLPSVSAVAMGGCTWSTAVFGWVVCVKWNRHECQDLKFPNGPVALSGQLGDILAASLLHSTCSLCFLD